MSIVSKTIRIAGPLGLYQLARVLTRSEPKLLMYHRFSSDVQAGKVSEAAFENQLKYIKKYFNPVTVAELANAKFEQNKLPANTIAISIDDGYQDFYHHAYPLLKKYQIPATLYVTTGFVAETNWLWPDKITWLLNHAPADRPKFVFDQIELSAGKIDDTEQKQDWTTLIRFLLSVDNKTKEACINKLAETWQAQLPTSAPEQYAACTTEQLLEMQQNGIEIGGHTVNHPSLGKVDADEAEYEILRCQDWLDAHLGTNHSRSFCYPNGTKSDYNDNVKKITEHKSSFNCAVTAFADHQGAADRYAIRRHTGSEDMFQFFKSLTGVELLSNKLKSAIR